MGKLKVLFIGGTGVISSACVREAVASHDIELYVLNRGKSATWGVPDGVTELRGDVREAESVRTPVAESTPLRNPYWQYARDKIACEDLLVAEYRDNGFPATIVRPSHTYDATKTVLSGGWTSLARMIAGKPVIVHGDGASLWTVTYNTDFARAFVPLLANSRTLGEAFHITSDDVLTWDQIAYALGAALGVTPRLVHVPSDVIAAHDPEWGAGLLGDKAHSMVFDNSKVKSVVPGWSAVVPFERGAREIAAWYLADSARQVVDEELGALMDKLAAGYGAS